MIDEKRITELLYKNAGLIFFVIGASFLLFGMFNIGILPHFYEAQSGSPSFDGTWTILLNMGLWLLFCLLLMMAGARFFTFRKEVAELKSQEGDRDALHFCLIGSLIIIGLLIYIVLMLMAVVKPLQFFPHVLFAGEETLMDLSIIFNALLLFFLLSLINRIGRKFIKYGLKAGGIL